MLSGLSQNCHQLRPRGSTGWRLACQIQRVPGLLLSTCYCVGVKRAGVSNVLSDASLAICCTSISDFYRGNGFFDTRITRAVMSA